MTVVNRIIAKANISVLAASYYEFGSYLILWISGAMYFFVPLYSLNFNLLSFY